MKTKIYIYDDDGHQFEGVRDTFSEVFEIPSKDGDIIRFCKAFGFRLKLNDEEIELD